MSQPLPPKVRNAIVVAIPILAVLLPLGYSVFAAMLTPRELVERGFLERPDPVHTNCVLDSKYMRLHHWEKLTAAREEVVRFGNRELVQKGGGREGIVLLGECQRCHTSRERFCDRCHEAVNLYPECWGCHYYP